VPRLSWRLAKYFWDFFVKVKWNLLTVQGYAIDSNLWETYFISFSILDSKGLRVVLLYVLCDLGHIEPIQIQ